MVGSDGASRSPAPSFCYPGASSNRICAKLAVAVFLFAAIVRADPKSAPAFVTRRAGEEKRVVIALFDRRILPKGALDTDDPIHHMVEMPLNHLGMVVRRRAIQDGPPSAAWVRDARAILTYFEGNLPAPDWLWPWLEAQRGKTRFVHLSNFGPLQAGDGGTVRVRRWLAGFGLDFDATHVEGPLAVGSRWRSRELCAYEADPRVAAAHRGPRNVSSGNTPWVETWLKTKPENRCAPVVVGPWGAVALSPWLVRTGDDDGTRRWYLDPFAFFRAALGLEGVPAPEPNVLNGRRMFFLHIDGDGFESRSSMKPGSPYCARVMADEIFDRYDLPWTVSVIVRSVTLDLKIKEPTDRMVLAREIMARKDVEVASHGVLHPLRWQRELKSDSPPRTITWYGGLKNYVYSPRNEVRDSIRFINDRLCPPGKRCRVMLWTGDAVPLKPALDECAEADCLNMNGGIYRWDALENSVGYVAPWSRSLGGAIQIYPGAPNENVYQGFFGTMPGAYAHVDKTIERTGSPRILKPANLYIHFYSVENPARTASIHRLLRRWAIKENTAPVFASTFIEAARDALAGAHYERTPNGWRFRAFGKCRTVRIDNEPRNVDFKKSSGLIGARRMNGALFLHLGEQDAEAVLTKTARSHPHIEQANHKLRNVKIDPNGVTFLSHAHSHRVIVVAGFRPKEKVRLGRKTQVTDQQGRLTMSLKPGRSRIQMQR